MTNGKVNHHCRKEEALARAIIESVLGMPTIINDNGHGGHDLNVLDNSGAPVIAIEVKRVASKAYFKLQNEIVQKGYSLKIELNKNWVISIAEESNVGEILIHLPIMLSYFENRKIYSVFDYKYRNKIPPNFRKIIKDNHIFDMYTLDDGVIGGSNHLKKKVFFSLHSKASAMRVDPIALLNEIESILTCRIEDKKWKGLRNNQIFNKQIFLIVNDSLLSDAAWGWFFSNGERLPTRAPKLPNQINGLWIIGYSLGLKWQMNTGWLSFRIDFVNTPKLNRATCCLSSPIASSN